MVTMVIMDYHRTYKSSFNLRVAASEPITGLSMENVEIQSVSGNGKNNIEFSLDGEGELYSLFCVVPSGVKGEFSVCFSGNVNTQESTAQLDCDRQSVKYNLTAED